MKSILKITAAFALSLGVSSVAYAQQNLRTAYFLDGYTYNYKLNPSFAPESGFFAIPAIGNFGAGLESNMSLSNFLYPVGDGHMVTFMHPSISDSQFLDRLDDVSRTDMSVNETLLAFGFRTSNAFHTVDLSLKGESSYLLPKDLFAFVKSGSSQATAWNIGGLGARVNARLELAYGYSRPVTDWMRIGARVKLLAGLARADLNVDKMDLSLDSKEWTVSSHGTSSLSGLLTVGTLPDQDNVLDYDSIEMPDDINAVVGNVFSSLGAAIDLGASFDFLEYFTASVSVLDLGFINWNGTTSAVMPEGTWSFKGFNEISFVEEDNFDEQFDTMMEDLEEMLRLEKTDDASKQSHMLGATLHAGIEARMPFYERLTFGILGTQRFDGSYSWTEGRVSANLAPTDWFSLAASYAASTFGHSAGGALNIHLPGICIYAGLDSFLPLLEVTPQYIPIKSMNTNLTLGLTLTFGRNNNR